MHTTYVYQDRTHTHKYTHICLSCIKHLISFTTKISIYAVYTNTPAHTRIPHILYTALTSYIHNSYRMLVHTKIHRRHTHIHHTCTQKQRCICALFPHTFHTTTHSHHAQRYSLVLRTYTHCVYALCIGIAYMHLCIYICIVSVYIYIYIPLVPPPAPQT